MRSFLTICLLTAVMFVGCRSKSKSIQLPEQQAQQQSAAEPSPEEQNKLSFTDDLSHLKLSVNNPGDVWQRVDETEKGNARWQKKDSFSNFSLSVVTLAESSKGKTLTEQLELIADQYVGLYDDFKASQGGSIEDENRQEATILVDGEKQAALRLDFTIVTKDGSEQRVSNIFTVVDDNTPTIVVGWLVENPRKLKDLTSVLYGSFRVERGE